MVKWWAWVRWIPTPRPRLRVRRRRRRSRVQRIREGAALGPPFFFLARNRVRHNAAPAAGRARDPKEWSGSWAATLSAHTIPGRWEIRPTALRRNNPAPTDAPPPPDRPARAPARPDYHWLPPPCRSRPAPISLLPFPGGSHSC